LAPFPQPLLFRSYISPLFPCLVTSAPEDGDSMFLRNDIDYKSTWCQNPRLQQEQENTCLQGFFIMMMHSDISQGHLIFTKNKNKHQIHSFIHSQALIVQDGSLASLFGVSWSHTYRHMVGLLWTSDQPVEKHQIIRE
jgi:hypothetical protein